MRHERRRIIPVQEREAMRKEIALAEADDRGESPELSREMKKQMIENPNARGVNNPYIQRMKRVLANGEPDSLSAAKKNKLLQRKKELEEWVKKRMVPRKWTQMRAFENHSTNPEFRKSVNFMAKSEYSREYLEKAHELKNINKELDPDNPEAGNLENIRPESGQEGA